MSLGLRSHATRFARFALAGGIATAIQYAILVLLVRGADLAPTPASSIGFVVSAGVNYLINYYYTFSSSRPHGPAATKFAVLAGAGLGLNALIMHLLLQAGAQYLLAQLCATAVVLVWNFIGNSLWTFGINRPARASDARGSARWSRASRDWPTGR